MSNVIYSSNMEQCYSCHVMGSRLVHTRKGGLCPECYAETFNVCLCDLCLNTVKRGRSTCKYCRDARATKVCGTKCGVADGT